MKLQLADKEYMLERSAYSFMALMSDFGGFNDGIAIFPAILMTIYNGKMYNAEKNSVFPIKRKAQRRGKNNGLQKKFEAEDALGQALKAEDIKNLQQEAKLVTFEEKASWLRSLFCCTCFCRKDRKLLMQDKTLRYMEK